MERCPTSVWAIDLIVILMLHKFPHYRETIWRNLILSFWTNFPVIVILGNDLRHLTLIWIHLYGRRVDTSRLCQQDYQAPDKLNLKTILSCLIPLFRKDYLLIFTSILGFFYKVYGGLVGKRSTCDICFLYFHFFRFSKQMLRGLL